MTTTDAARVDCAECARLERERESARTAGDWSRVTDCAVLLRRHPDHDGK